MAYLDLKALNKRTGGLDVGARADGGADVVQSFVSLNRRRKRAQGFAAWILLLGHILALDRAELSRHDNTRRILGWDHV